MRKDEVKVSRSETSERRHLALSDEVIVEEPLEIRLDGHLVATTMRTPGHDYELAVGPCVAENLSKKRRLLGSDTAVKALQLNTNTTL